MFVPKGPINNIPALVQIMAWRRPGDKPLSEPIMVSLLTRICVTRPQWVKVQSTVFWSQNFDLVENFQKTVVLIVIFQDKILCATENIEE